MCREMGESLRQICEPSRWIALQALNRRMHRVPTHSLRRRWHTKVDLSKHIEDVSASYVFPLQGCYMPAYAATKSAVIKSKINKRLFIPKLLFLPAIAFALVSQAAYVEDGFWDTTWEVVSFLILLTAAFGRIWSAAYISGRKNHELVVDGPYSLTRNPLYFFSFLGYLGAGLAFE